MNDIPVPERLLEVFHNKRPMPLKLEFRPTKRCNLYCRHCWRRLSGKREVNCDNELSPERYVEFVREAVGLGVRKVELVGGGEPLFDPDAAMTIFREVKRQGMFGNLITNGTRFTDEIICEMVELGWDRIMFSIDGANAKTHDYIRAQTGVFRRAVTAIKRFTYWKRKLGVDRPLLGMIPVLTNRNCTQFKNFVELAHRLGVYHVGFKPLAVQTPDAQKLKILPSRLEEMNSSISEAIPIADKYDIDTNLRSIVHKPDNDVVEKADEVATLYRKDVSAMRAQLNSSLGLASGGLAPRGLDDIYGRFSSFLQVPCYLPWIHLTITPGGDVLPCTGAGTLKGLPNVRETSLGNALSGEMFTSFREQLAQGILPKVCEGCCVGLFFDNQRYRKALVEQLEGM